MTSLMIENGKLIYMFFYQILVKYTYHKLGNGLAVSLALLRFMNDRDDLP